MLSTLIVFSILVTLTAFLPTPYVKAIGGSISLSLSDGPKGTTVHVTGTGFTATDTGTCTITSSVANVIGSSSCTMSAGTITSAQFTVSAAAPAGPTTITVTAPVNFDFATASFSVDAAPVLVLFPTSGGRTTTVSVTLTGGTQFSTGDSSCTISSSPSGLIGSQFCQLNLGVLVNSQFVVSSSASGGTYTVTVTASPGGATASAVFSVPPTPTLTLSPNSGGRGTVVTVSGTGFPTSGTCALFQTPAGLFNLTVTHSCALLGTSGSISGTFAVAFSTPAGTYVVTANVTGGATSANASTTFTVGAPVTFITLQPASATPSSSVAVSGSGFANDETSCTITGPGKVVTVPLCSISAGNVGGSFTVNSTTPPGIYLITVKGQGPAGDFAEAFLAVPFFQVTTSSTTVTTTVATSSTTFSTSVTSTFTQISQSTTTQTFTGVSTETATVLSLFSITGQTVQTFTSFSTATETTTLVSTSTSTTTTTTASLAGAIRPFDSLLLNLLGLLGLIVLVPVVFRRLS